MTLYCSSIFAMEVPKNQDGCKESLKAVWTGSFPPRFISASLNIHRDSPGIYEGSISVITDRQQRFSSSIGTFYCKTNINGIIDVDIKEQEFSLTAKVDRAKGEMIVSKFRYFSPEVSGKLNTTPKLLIETSRVSINGLRAPVKTVFDPSGKYVYVINPYDKALIFKKDNYGKLTPDGALDIGAGNIIFDPSGKYAYVVNFTQNTFIYKRNFDGKLVPDSEIEGSKFWDMTFDLSGNYAYATSVGDKPKIYIYKKGDDGKLKPYGDPLISEESYWGGIKLDPLGKYLYMFGNSDNIYIYKKSNDGKLTMQQKLATPRFYHMTIDPSGKYVYLSNSLDNKMFFYKKNDDGKLIYDSTIEMNSPRKVLFSKSGDYAYVIGFKSVFLIYKKESDGTLKFLGSDEVAHIPNDINFDPLEQFIYITNSLRDSAAVIVYLKPF
jgi:DNA-binding beta-propeller fold protein YncE